MTVQKTINVLFCGTGGQGVLKASEVLGWAALLEGAHVKKSEVHGMAQRGGSVESHLRFGLQVFAPLIAPGQADFLVAFHRGEHDRMQHFLKTGGTDLVECLAAAERQIADARYLNTYLLGALSRHLSLAEDSWLRALAAVFPAKFLEANRKIFLQARTEPRPSTSHGG
jgi:indolepyruvate ferredoxin oxidoreductase beta subunit